VVLGGGKKGAVTATNHTTRSGKLPTPREMNGMIVEKKKERRRDQGEVSAHKEGNAPQKVPSKTPSKSRGGKASYLRLSQKGGGESRGWRKSFGGSHTPSATRPFGKEKKGCPSTRISKTHKNCGETAPLQNSDVRQREIDEVKNCQPGGGKKRHLLYLGAKKR